jgi:glycosyltransferase involved in cell wall biosynthesis
LLKDIGKIKTNPMVESDKRDGTRSFTSESLTSAVNSLLALSGMDICSLAGTMRHLSTTHVSEWRSAWKQIMSFAIDKKTNKPFTFPPPLPSSIPTVGILTLTYNRKKWWQNMAENILRQKYPHEKIVWIVVDDSDSSERVDHPFSIFQTSHPKIKSHYLSLSKKESIGKKRNLAAELAISKGATILMHMDDDDYYPSSSIVARLSWLNLQNSKCIYSSTIPMYDAKRYISAINVPPLYLAPNERVSESSLAYTKEFFETKNFPTIDVAEGEDFIKDRIEESLEVMPDGILVAIQHSLNATSRRVPEDQEPNGCHYGFSDEYFSYVSTIA